MEKSQQKSRTTERSHTFMLFDETQESRSLSKSDVTGTFRVTIKLKQMWLRSNFPPYDTFTLSYLYPPFGIVKKQFTTSPDPSINSGLPNKICSVIRSGTWSEILSASQILATSQQPMLKVQLNYRKDERKGLSHFAFAELPMGDIFSQIQMPNENCISEIIGEAFLIKIKSNREFGKLDYTVKVEKLSDNKEKSSKEKSMKIMKADCKKKHLDVDVTKFAEESIGKFHLDVNGKEIGRLVRERVELLQSYKQDELAIQYVDKKIGILSRYLD